MGTEDAEQVVKLEVARVGVVPDVVHDVRYLKVDSYSDVLGGI